MVSAFEVGTTPDSANIKKVEAPRGGSGLLRHLEASFARGMTLFDRRISNTSLKPLLRPRVARFWGFKAAEKNSVGSRPIKLISNITGHNISNNLIKHRMQVHLYSIS